MHCNIYFVVNCDAFCNHFNKDFNKDFMYVCMRVCMCTVESAVPLSGLVFLVTTPARNKNLAIANRSRVSCAHNTLRASICINITP